MDRQTSHLLKKIIQLSCLIDQVMGNESNKEGGLLEGDKSSYKQLKDDLSQTCKCSLKTRIIGWVVCCLVGWLLSILSSIVFIIKHDITIFAIFYSIGQILNITGSCFLSGPKQQVKDMFKKTRWVLTLLYLGSMLATLLLAFLLPEQWRALILVTLVVQMISYFLYTFSYVPFGRKILKKVCQCIVLGD